MKPLPITLVLALLISLSLWFFSPLFSLPKHKPPLPVPHTHVSVLWSSSADPSLFLESELLDTTPLYIPTRWNFTSIPQSAIHKRFLPPALYLYPNHFLIQQGKIWAEIQPDAPTAVESKIRTVLNSNDNIPYDRFWQIAHLPSYQPPKRVQEFKFPVQIRDPLTGEIHWSGDITTPADEVSTLGFLPKPISFHILITSEGSLGPILIESEVSDFQMSDLFQQKSMNLDYWKQALPGYYEVLIGIL